VSVVTKLGGDLPEKLWQGVVDVKMTVVPTKPHRLTFGRNLSSADLFDAKPSRVESPDRLAWLQAVIVFICRLVVHEIFLPGNLFLMMVLKARPRLWAVTKEL